MTNSPAENKNYKSVGNQESVFEREVWNKAIEAAAREAELWMDETIPTRIRELKK